MISYLPVFQISLVALESLNASQVSALDDLLYVLQQLFFLPAKARTSVKQTH